MGCPQRSNMENRLFCRNNVTDGYGCVLIVYDLIVAGENGQLLQRVVAFILMCGCSRVLFKAHKCPVGGGRRYTQRATPIIAASAKHCENTHFKTSMFIVCIALPCSHPSHFLCRLRPRSLGRRRSPHIHWE